MLEIGVGLVVLIVRIARGFWSGGWRGINYLGLGLFAGGWVIGGFLSELDHLLYALMCNPQEVSCQRIKGEIVNKRYKSAWEMVMATKSERTKLPVHNVLTGILVTIVAIWLISSSGSSLGMGVGAGLAVKLLVEFWQDREWGKWYWIIAREMTEQEHKIIKWVWTGLVGIMVVMVM